MPHVSIIFNFINKFLNLKLIGNFIGQCCHTYVLYIV
ncbi:hypothetical protein CPR19088_GLDEOEPO_02201 [Companilactobacillus paralimentarius]